MKTLLIPVFFLAVGFCCAQSDSIPVVNKVDELINPFPTLDYDTVIAYNLNYEPATKRKTHYEIDFGHKLEGFDVYKLNSSSDFTGMSASQVKRLVETVNDTSTYGKNYADCFEPRFGITFFKNNKQVYSILICFGCGFLVSSTHLPAPMQRYYDIESAEWDQEKQEHDESKPILVRRYLKGFSDKGRKRLLNLCKELDMGYCSDR